MSQPNGPAGEGFHGPNLAYVLEMYEDFRALAHPSTEDYDDTIEAHYACLGRLRPHACIDGWIFVGYKDEHGEEREASYPCRRSADSPGGQ